MLLSHDDIVSLACININIYIYTLVYDVGRGDTSITWETRIFLQLETKIIQLEFLEYEN